MQSVPLFLQLVREADHSNKSVIKAHINRKTAIDIALPMYLWTCTC